MENLQLGRITNIQTIVNLSTIYYYAFASTFSPIPTPERFLRLCSSVFHKTRYECERNHTFDCLMSLNLTLNVDLLPQLLFSSAAFYKLDEVIVKRLLINSMPN